MNAKQSGHIKIGLVVVLAIVFVGAAVNSAITIRKALASPPQPPPQLYVTAAPQPGAPPATSQTTAPSAAVEAPQEATKVGASKQTWPTFELDEIIAYDPFANPKSSEAVSAANPAAPAVANGKEAARTPAEEAAAAKSEAEAAAPARIVAVYQRGGRTAALIGSKTVRPGDQLEGGRRVVVVDQEGMTLEVNK